MDQLKSKRAERAKAEQQRRDDLKRQHEEKKRKEQEIIQKEISVGCFVLPISSTIN